MPFSHLSVIDQIRRSNAQVALQAANSVEFCDAVYSCDTFTQPPE